MLITISRQFGAGGSEVGERGSRRRWAGAWWTTSSSSAWPRGRGSRPEDVAAAGGAGPQFIERLARTLVAATPGARGATGCRRYRGRR